MNEIGVAFRNCKENSQSRTRRLSALWLNAADPVSRVMVLRINGAMIMGLAILTMIMLLDVLVD